jgi:hypothetical protein
MQLYCAPPYSAQRCSIIDDLATVGEMNGIFSMTSLLKSLKLDIILESFVLDIT